jgi:ABC-type bacteriocin/lantibiotic exporter with double-glycine peptidase domain
MFYGSNLVTEGGISVGNLLAYYGLVILFYKNTETIVVSYQQAQKAYAAHLQVNDLKITQADPRFNAMQMPLVAHHNEPLLCCKNVNFYYNKRAAPVLKNINLNINTGQQIALVGTTGSGKSSLAKLLCGSYAPDQGNILLAGTNICSFSATDFYKNFAYVSQEIALFSGTLYENITLGHEKLSLHKINCALQQAGLQELIAQRGLHALVTENGDNFSGGEKQRLEIARALLLDTPILILDEATSALDLITEATIIDNLRRLSKTIIYVAHRLSTIQHCDVIYVLEHGRIIEQGSHQQLLQRQQRYFQLTQEEGSLNVC